MTKTEASDGARDALLPRVHARGLARHAKHKDPTRFLLLSQFNLRCDLATFVRKPACQSRLCGTERDVMHGTRSGSRALRGHGATARGAATGFRSGERRGNYGVRCVPEPVRRRSVMIVECMINPQAI